MSDSTKQVANGATEAPVHAVVGHVVGHVNPEVKPGDQFQVGIELTSGEIMWGTIQIAIKVDSEGRPWYRPKWAKVEKIAEYWRVPNARINRAGRIVEQHPS